MPRPISQIFSLFRPTGEALSREEKDQIQIHRLLSVLGSLFVPLFGLLYKISSGGVFDPMGPRLLIALLFAGLLALSYLSGHLRRHYVWWMRGILYVLVGWVVVLAVVNEFAGDYAVGLLLTYAVLVPVLGLGAGSMRPVLWFLGVGLCLTVGGAALAPAFRTSPLIVLGSMATLALVDGITIQGWLSARRKTQRRSDAMEAAPDGMAILGSEGTYTHVNRAHAEIYGYRSPAAFLGNSWKMCYGPEELSRFEEKVMPQLFEEGTWRGEATGRRADGSTFSQGLALTVLADGGIVCIVRDITERKKRERKLREAKEEAEEAARLKSAMLANMSHEIRTPLTSILGFAEAIAEEAGKDEGPVGKFARLIGKSGHRLMETLTGMLNLSRLEAGEMELSGEAVDLSTEARGVAEQFGSKAKEDGVDLQVENAGRPTWAEASEEGLRIVLRNLLSNAIKYTETGGRVWVRTCEESGTAAVEVEDTGIGMEPGQVEELFEAFKQESEGIGREYEGTGLGLTIAREAVEEMGGTIDVETEKGEGTCFTVRFPHLEVAQNGQ